MALTSLIGGQDASPSQCLPAKATFHAKQENKVQTIIIFGLDGDRL